MKNIRKTVIFAVIILLIHTAVPAIPALAAYTDTSVYKIETTKEFNSESTALKAAEQLKKDMGWKAEVKPSGKNGTTYVLTSEGVEGESRAKNLLLQFEKETGLKASYGPVGQKEPFSKAVSKEFAGEAKAKDWALQFEKETGLKATYTIAGNREAYVKVVTGGIEGEDNTKAILDRFQKETGLKASYAPYGAGQALVKLYSGEIADESKAKSLLVRFEKEIALKGTIETVKKQQPRYKIATGSIQGETNAKNLLKQFEKELKVKGAYEAAGQPAQLYNVKSGYFNDEKSAKNAAGQIKKNTGLTSSTEKVKGTRFWIVSMKSVDSQNLKKIDAFFKKKTWRYTAAKTGKKQTSFRIVSVPLSDQKKANDGIRFFKNKNIQASAQSAGSTTVSRFRIASGETAVQARINQGLEFFKKNGAAGTAGPTGKKVYSHYQLTTESVYEQDKVTKALNFFKEAGIHAEAVKTGQYYSRYKLSSEALIGTEKLQQALGFFSKRNIPGKIEQTGEYGYRQYQVTTGQITSKADLDKGLNVFKKNNVSATYQTKSVSLFHISINEQFTGKDRADAAANRIKTNYGWPVNVVKVKNGPQITTTDYGITLSQMVDKQMKVSPQTDAPAYVSLSYINTANQTVTADQLNIRSSPLVTSGNIIGQLQKGDKVNIISQENGWAKIRMNWRNASRDEVEKYVNPKNFTQDSSAYFQFLKLSQTAGLNAAEVNAKILYNKGILTGKGQAFIDAARAYSINELYLISHSLLETGNGTSELAKGTMFNGKKVYNMYGVGAYDSNPLYYGAKYAYEQGWFTPEAAIKGGAKFIGAKYIHHPTYKQDTLYKMRWSPNALHQYATDVGWAYKQVGRMYSLYTLLDQYTLYYDVPVYR
ncbi:N-acetylglucosaminidase [Bacillus haynesii]|uniref:N-acetylglucosaminidase n=1 Tax=Bacillus haynesii TaxID=1925021 RepID=UPI0022824DFB|nr:N-acetylglucosaminidase [Bacillus haynesii]MCY9223958.1 N-acetylglucosaminidase [Bacillus haynesii]